MLGVAREGHLLFRIEFAGRVKQTQNSGVDQIIEIHMHRKILMHPHRNRLHQRKMLEYNPIAPGDLGGRGALSGLGFHLSCLSFWSGLSWPALLQVQAGSQRWTK